MPAITVGTSRFEKKVRAMANGFLARGGFEPDKGESGVLALSIPDACRELLREAGDRDWESVHPGEAVRRAMSHDFSLRLAMRSNGAGDVPSLLAPYAGRALLAAFNETKATWRSWCHLGEAKNFKTQTRIQLASQPALRETGEAGEVLAGKVADTGESFALAQYARRISFSLVMLMNDDLAALRDTIAPFGHAGRALPARLVYAHLLDNPTMVDGTALFHADHGNLRTGGGSALSDTSLPTAVSDFLKQTEPQAPNEDTMAEPQDLEAAVLLVPPELTVKATKVTDPNLRTKDGALEDRVTIEIEPRLSQTGFSANVSATAWFLASRANRARHGAIEVCFLEGAGEAPALDTSVSRERLGLEFRARLACAARAVNHRRIHRNDGA